MVSLGCCALCAQSIFVRELVPLFSGTEFVLGALLAGWLISVGAGGLLGGRLGASQGTGGERLFVSLVCGIAILLPATVLCIRFGRGLIVRPAGALPAPGAALSFALLAIAPFGLVYGSMYNVACRLGSGRPGGMRGSIARIYAWEAAGSFAGALLFSFVLIIFFSQLQAALTASLLALLSVAAYPPGGGRGIRKTVAVGAIGIALGSLSPAIDRASMGVVYPGYRIERFMASRHGEVVVASRGEVTSVFSGGSRLFSYPEPERVQEVIHIPLLSCSEPRSVLLIGCSLGGGWVEALKHRSVRTLDCVELEGSLFALPPDTATRARSDARVRFIAADGRFFLSRAARRYDCIILGSPPPLNLQWNRWYTREFFETARRSLAPGGVLAFTHPSSENYLTGAQSRTLRVLERTLAGVFESVMVLPGSTTHFVASEAATSPDSIGARLARRRIDAPFVSEAYLPFRFSAERRADLDADLAAAGNPAINTDARPSLPLAELAIEGARTGSPILSGFAALSRLRMSVLGLVLLAAMVLLFSLSRRAWRARLAVASVGCASLIMQTLILLSYQGFSGLLYQGIVLLTALFMAGAAAGALASMRRSGGVATLRALHLVFALLAAALAFWSIAMSRFSVSYGAGSAGYFLFAACAGFLTGAYYPIVVRTAFPEGKARAPALFYAWDLFGACIGGLAGGLVLFPVFGLGGGAASIVLIHLGTAIMLAGRWGAARA